MWNILFGGNQKPVKQKIDDTLADHIPEDYL